ncbi:hypothetical protein ACPWT1_00965 [Ramlibacter sp. MMS24-I3-19]
MHELVNDEVEQVSGGLTYYYTPPKGVFIVIDGEVVMPSPGPVASDPV